MSNGVDFEVDELSSVVHKTTRVTVGQRLVRRSGGLIKNENQANYVLFGFVVLAIIVSIFLILKGGTIGRPDDIKILPA